MPDDWRTERLTDVYEIGSGLSKPRSEFGFGNPFLSFKDVLDNYFVPTRLSALVNSTEKERTNCSIRRGDVFLTRTSETQPDLGMSCVALTDHPSATFNGFTKRLRPKSPHEVVPEYAAYYFRGPKFRQDVTAMSSLSTRASLNNEMLSRLTVVLPPNNEQVAIAAILKSLDDKIELNRRMNETLEEMARAIFQSWFVDFDPVRASAEGRDPGLPKPIAGLFPDDFADSPLGPIPERWTIQPIGDVVRCVGGATPSTKEAAYWDGQFRFATPKDMAPLTASVLLETERGITEAGLEQISSGLLPRGTVLLSSRAPIGYLAIAEIPVAVNQGFIAMVCDGALPNHYVVNWARANMDVIKGNANGTTFLEISKKNYRPIPAIVPPPEILDEFVRIVGPLHSQVVANLASSRSLAAIRDALLPKLLSGDLRVPSAERMVKRA